MCMEDVRLGRLTLPKLTSQALSTTDAVVIGNDPRRRSLHFLPPSSGVAWISPGIPAVAGKCYGLTPSSLPLRFLVDQDGENVVREWHAIADAGTPTLTIIEHALFKETEKVLDESA